MWSFTKLVILFSIALGVLINISTGYSSSRCTLSKVYTMLIFCWLIPSTPSLKNMPSGMFLPTFTAMARQWRMVVCMGRFITGSLFILFNLLRVGEKYAVRSIPNCVLTFFFATYPICKVTQSIVAYCVCFFITTSCRTSSRLTKV